MLQSTPRLKSHKKHYLSIYRSSDGLMYNQNLLNAQLPFASMKQINKFRQLISKAAVGGYFLIQLTDSTETFHEYDHDLLQDKLDFIQQLADFFYKKTGSNVLKVKQIKELNTQFKPDQNELTQLNTYTGFSYNLSTHFLWLNKSSISNPSYINYLKKMENPIAMQIGADTSIKNLIHMINELDPNQLPGRITLIPGLGIQSVHSVLPKLIEAVQKTGRTVLWGCDPMHGNTVTRSSEVKTIQLCNIIDEIKNSFSIHRQMDSQLNLISLEATHQDVSECENYTSMQGDWFNKNCKNSVTPRLNYAQAMHVIQCAAKHYAKF